MVSHSHYSTVHGAQSLTHITTLSTERSQLLTLLHCPPSTATLLTHITAPVLCLSTDHDTAQHVTDHQRHITALGSTENAGLENAGLENAGPNGRGGKHRTGKRGTKWQGWKTQDWKTREHNLYG